MDIANDLDTLTLFQSRAYDNVSPFGERALLGKRLERGSTHDDGVMKRARFEELEVFR
jgi:hypothetical protein